MPGYFLGRIQIEGFRGINNTDDPLDLRFDPIQVNSVFGQNGLGKSSIFDAIAFAIRGNIARLDDMHEDELAKQCYNNRFHARGEATIKLTLSPDDGSADVEVQVELSARGVRKVTSRTGHPTPQTLLKSLDNPFLLLDHKAFMSFVEESPLNRGRTFSSLLGLGRLSEFRQVLEVLARTQNLNTDLRLTQLEAEVKTAEASDRPAGGKPRSDIAESSLSDRLSATETDGGCSGETVLFVQPRGRAPGFRPDHVSFMWSGRARGRVASDPG